MKSYLKYRALVYDPTANRQWESVNSPAEERLLLTRPGTQSYWVLPKFFSRICELNRKAFNTTRFWHIFHYFIYFYFILHPTSWLIHM
jgi:hypothetical protein